MRKIVAIFLAFIIFIPYNASADFLADWIDQHSYTGPNYFEGEKRGYLHGGSFSLRYEAGGSDYLFTINPPRIKGGCGGIDIFLGSFGFLNLEYLVKKLQRMIQAAPAIAFDIALQTLSQSLSSSVKEFKSIIDKLNNIQFDECKASQIIKTRIVDPKSPSIGESLKNAMTEIGHQTGILDLYYEATEMLTRDEGKVSSDIIDKMDDKNSEAFNSCPSEFKDVFLTEGSMLDNIASRYGLNTDFTPEIRGEIGDIQITPGNPNEGRPIVLSVIPPCPGNVSTQVAGKDKVAENAKKEVRYSIYSNCSETRGGREYLKQWIRPKLLNVARDMKAKRQLQEDNVNFLKKMPIGMYTSLKDAVATGMEAGEIEKITEIATDIYAYKIVEDFLLSIRKYLARPETVAGKTVEGPKCRLDLIRAEGKLEDLIEKAEKKLASIKKDYINRINELNSINAHLQTIKAMQSQYKDMTPITGKGK